MSTNVSSVVSHFPDAENGFTTTTAGSTASGAATVTLNSVAGYTNGEPAVFVIEPTSTTAKQTFTGIIDTSGVQVTSVVWTAGTNQTHALGSTVVDYATATHIAMISKGIKVDHLQTGRHIVANNYDPSNTTLETQKWTGVASAVNEPNTTNAITGNPVRYGASGGDTNIDTYIVGKGTGSGRHAGIYDGWVAADETLTYASATTFTCSAALAAILGAGDRIKLTQTTVKYFYVVSVSGTTVTVTGGADYSLANAAITLPFYSHEESPTSFPREFSYTPTYVNLTVGNGTHQTYFNMSGKQVNVRLGFAEGGTSSVGTAPTFTLPVASASTYTSGHWLGAMRMVAAATGFQGYIQWASSTTALLSAINAAGTYTQDSNITSAIPAAWGTTGSIYGNLQYMAA